MLIFSLHHKRSTNKFLNDGVATATIRFSILVTPTRVTSCTKAGSRNSRGFISTYICQPAHASCFSSCQLILRVFNDTVFQWHRNFQSHKLHPISNGTPTQHDFGHFILKRLKSESFATCRKKWGHTPKQVFDRTSPKSLHPMGREMETGGKKHLR